MCKGQGFKYSLWACISTSPLLSCMPCPNAHKSDASGEGQSTVGRGAVAKAQADSQKAPPCVSVESHLFKWFQWVAPKASLSIKAGSICTGTLHNSSECESARDRDTWFLLSGCMTFYCRSRYAISVASSVFTYNVISDA